MRRQDLGMSLLLGGLAWAILQGFVITFRWMVRHPIFSTISVGSLVLFAVVGSALDNQFNLITIDGPELVRMSESEYAEQYAPDRCEEDGSVTCVYDHGRMEVYFSNGQPMSINYDASRFIFREFTNTEEFYRYVLERSGFSYQEPTYSDMDEIVWEGLPEAERVTLTSNYLMEADRLVIEPYGSGTE